MPARRAAPRCHAPAASATGNGACSWRPECETFRIPVFSGRRGPPGPDRAVGGTRNESRSAPGHHDRTTCHRNRNDARTRPSDSSWPGAHGSRPTTLCRPPRTRWRPGCWEQTRITPRAGALARAWRRRPGRAGRRGRGGTGGRFRAHPSRPVAPGTQLRAGYPGHYRYLRISAGAYQLMPRCPGWPICTADSVSEFNIMVLPLQAA